MVNRKPFTVESIGQLLVGYGYIDESRLGDILMKAGHTRRQLERNRIDSVHFPGSRKYDVLPPELIAAMEVPLAHDSNQVVTEDLIYELLARVEGMRYVKIDPLKLDAKVVTGYFSRPFARRAVAAPVDQNGRELYVAVANPYDVELIENLNRITGKKVVPVLSSKSDILRVITEVYGFRKSVTAAEESIDAAFDIGNLEQYFKLQDVEQIEENDQHIVNAVDYLLHYAFDQRASDIHIEPKRDYGRIRLRIDGVLHNVYTIPKKVQCPGRLAYQGHESPGYCRAAASPGRPHENGSERKRNRDSYFHHPHRLR